MVEVKNLKKLCGVNSDGNSISVDDKNVSTYIDAYTSNKIGKPAGFSRENISLPLMNAALDKLQKNLNLSSNSNKDETISSIAKLKNEIEMVEETCKSGLSAITDVDNAYNALGKDVNKFNEVLSKQKKHINELRDNFELTRSEREKEIAINIYYSKLYDAYLDVLKVIVLFAFILVILGLLNRVGILSDNIQLYLSLTVIILCCVITLRKLVDIYNRSPHNFDEYKWMEDDTTNLMSRSEYNNKNFSNGNGPRAPSKTLKKKLLDPRCPKPQANISEDDNENADADAGSA